MTVMPNQSARFSNAAPIGRAFSFVGSGAPGRLVAAGILAALLWLAAAWAMGWL